MEAFCRAVVLFTLACVVGCSARTGVVFRSPEFSAPFLPDDVTFELAPVADTVVHNAASWSAQDLSAEPWVMVGSNGDGLVWMTYLKFDLSVVPAGWQPSVATLNLDRLLTPPLPTAAPRMQVDVRLTVGDWAEQRVSWDAPVGVGDEVVATCELVADSAASDSCDLTLAVTRALQVGHTSFGLLLLPSDPGIDFRRRWPGTTGARPTQASAASADAVVADPASTISLVLTRTAP